MPRNYGRIKVEVWEVGSDFKRLEVGPQWLYMMLVSQPVVSLVGTLVYGPRKWSRLAGGLTLEQLEQLVERLEAERYVLVDRETEELLIRSFVKHDEPWRLPNLLTGARLAYRAVESDTIRGYLLERHPWLVDETDPGAVKEYEHTRMTTGMTTDVATGMTTGIATDGALADVASPSPSASPIRGEEAGGDTQPPTPLEAASAESANGELPQEQAFQQANRFVTTSGGWQDPHLEATLRREYPELIEEDVGSLLATADELREREVA